MTRLYLFLLWHKHDNRQRTELIFGNMSAQEARSELRAIWPSWMCSEAPYKIGLGISQEFWVTYLEICNRAKNFQADVQAMIIGDAYHQRWGIAYQKRKLLMSVQAAPLPAQEFRLDSDLQAFAARNQHLYTRVKPHPSMPIFHSFYGDSL